MHASLLPRWRGAAPIQHALLAGDSETGITIMQMEEGLDTGPILLQQAVPIAPGVTAAELSETLAALGARLIVDALDGVARGTLAARPQPQEGVTYARKISREDGRLDWRLPAAVLGRQVRALDPWPGAFFEGPRIRTRRAHSGARRRRLAGMLRRSTPGTVLDEQLVDRLRRRGVAAAAAAARRAVPRLDVAAFLRGSPDRRRDGAAVPRYKLTIEYDGTGLVGWQRQANGLSVQEALETAITRFLRRAVSPSMAPGAPMRACTRSAQSAHLDLARDGGA